jgi:hypothetical protein
VAQARQFIMATAITDAATGTIPPLSNIWGAGRLNALGAVDCVVTWTAVRPPRGRGTGTDAQGRLVLLSGSRLRFTGSAGEVTIELFSLQGRCVLRQAGRRTVPLARLPQGVYFARVSHRGKAIASRKISLLH